MIKTNRYLYQFTCGHEETRELPPFASQTTCRSCGTLRPISRYIDTEIREEGRCWCGALSPCPHESGDHPAL